MAVTPGTSGILAATLSLLLMAGLQIFKGYLVTSRLSIIFTGFLGSVLFLFILTAISNFEMATFGNHFQAKFKEVTISMLITLFVVGLVHRVAVTTCILFSITALYFVNRISAKVYQTNFVPQSHSAFSKGANKKKKN